jgi:hypothetical protein
MASQLYDKWILRLDSDNGSQNIFEYLNLAINNLGLDSSNVQMGEFVAAHNIAKYELVYLNMFIMNEPDSQFESVDTTKDIMNERFAKLFRTIIDAGNAISSILCLTSSMTLEDIGKEKTTKADDMFRYSELNYENLNPVQLLVIYTLKQLQRREYRRYIVEDKGMCYQKIYNSKGQDTHAWKPAMTVKQFVYDITRREINADMWVNLTSAKDNINFVTVHVTESPAPEFEDLDKDRHIFSFNNGLYIIKIPNVSEQGFDQEGPEQFERKQEGPEQEGPEWKDQWIPFEGPGSKKIGASVVSSKYFDFDFIDCRHYSDWFDIIRNNCPNFMNVMNYQQWPEDVQRWLCILMGRMLYEVGELDDWQVFIFLLGMAGTGKSTIIENILKQFYEAADIGIVGNNAQKTFALSGLIGKKIILGPEIKGNWTIDQAELQSMVSGESVSVNIKYKGAASEKFKAHLAIAGNVAPEFQDNAGSMSRRTVVFPFEHKVKKSDSRLGGKIKKELGFILQGCNRAYLDAVHKYGAKGIWEILPELFRTTRENMAENTNALTHFLNSDNVKIGPDFYCREQVFTAAFNEHCRQAHFQVSKWTSQFYNGPFADMGLKVTKNSRRRYPNLPHAQVYHGTFIIGVDIKDTIDVKADELVED